MLDGDEIANWEACVYVCERERKQDLYLEVYEFVMKKAMKAILIVSFASLPISLTSLNIQIRQGIGSQRQSLPHISNAVLSLKVLWDEADCPRRVSHCICTIFSFMSPFGKCCFAP